MRSAIALLLVAVPALGQQPAAAPAPPKEWNAPAVGAVAPDFSLDGATRYGLLEDQVRLSTYRGNTVVLAFFFRARTRG